MTQITPEKITFEQGLNIVVDLVKQFRRNVAAYRGPTYKEALARRDLIDPFFEALGRDVNNCSSARLISPTPPTLPATIGCRPSLITFVLRRS